MQSPDSGLAPSSEIHSFELVVPELANHYGTLYGAKALQIMGKAAFVCASRHAGCAIVMARADDIEFHKPVKLGDIIDVRAKVVEQGLSSMTVVVDIVADGRSRAPGAPAVTGRFKMVAVDAKGAPMPIPAQAARAPEGDTLP